MDPLDFGGKKFKIEIDSSIIWREEFRTRVPPQLLAERATAQPTTMMVMDTAPVLRPTFYSYYEYDGLSSNIC